MCQLKSTNLYLGLRKKYQSQVSKQCQLFQSYYVVARRLFGGEETSWWRFRWWRYDRKPFCLRSMTFFNEFKFKVGQISFHDFEIVAKILFDAKSSRTKTICTERNVSANIKRGTKGKGLAIK